MSTDSQRGARHVPQPVVSLFAGHCGFSPQMFGEARLAVREIYTGVNAHQ
ncbi:MAG: hypothetical protein LBD01_05015 [Puniceicoccales bacterium]|nr:hypothetical protein [Puniceicoccales bacterium]